jgi:pheromone shutdown protein TraB
MSMDLEYLRTVNKLTDTVKELALYKENKSNKKVKDFKFIIILLIITNILVSAFFSGTMSYFIYNIYNYKSIVTNVNTNSNTNENSNTNTISK